MTAPETATANAPTKPSRGSRSGTRHPGVSAASFNGRSNGADASAAADTSSALKSSAIPSPRVLAYASLRVHIRKNRDEVQAEQKYEPPPRVGAAGGIGTPSAALAAFQMGAAYVVTGSVNQSCLEASTSAHSKALLAEADLADVMMAPAADMFEMGVKVQLLKRGTLFPVRAQRLYELYRDFDGIEALPASERDRLERQLFRRGLNDVGRRRTVRALPADAARQLAPALIYG